MLAQAHRHVFAVEETEQQTLGKQPFFSIFLNYFQIFSELMRKVAIIFRSLKPLPEKSKFPPKITSTIKRLASNGGRHLRFTSGDAFAYKKQDRLM